LKLGVLAKDEWFTENREIKEIEPFVTYNINQASAIHLRYKYKSINKIEERNTILSLFWYY